MKRIVCLIAAAVLLLSMAAVGYTAETETTAPTQPPRPANACGEDLTWVYADGVLTISGTGDMDDLSAGAPWDGYVTSIQKVVLSGGVTSVGAGAFDGYTNLTAVDFGSSLRQIGERAFQGCTGLTEISLPATFRLFGASCFEGSSNLTKVHCAGSMPSFRSNCLWNGNHITVYCPDNNRWAESYVGELETNFHGRLEVLTESGQDVYVWPEETTTSTESPTEAPTEATTVPTTQPVTEPTEAATQPATEATSAPTTEATLPPVETSAEPTIPTTEQPAEPEQESGAISGILVGVFILSGTLSLALIGMLIFKGKDGRYRD